MIRPSWSAPQRLAVLAFGLALTAAASPAQAQQDNAATAALVAACNQAIPLKGYANSWFAQPSSNAIKTLDQAVDARARALRGANDGLAMAIKNVQHVVDLLEKQVKQAPGDRHAPIELDCAHRYAAYLQSLDAPSWELARKAAADASAAQLAQQRAELEARQKVQDAAADEEARRQQEMAITTAKLNAEAAQREKERQYAVEAAAAAGKAQADEAQRAAEKLPGCAEAQVLELVKQAVAASPAGHAYGVRVLDLQNPRETGVSGPPPKRSCFAEMATTAGPSWGAYSIAWASGDQDRVLVEVRLKP
ncbi:MAG: hypothetical protein P4L66_15875 [Acetobacteraceae bacterium]|nr:hypothetical protein [Acetobacteraceae bacterium]